MKHDDYIRRRRKFDDWVRVDNARIAAELRKHDAKDIPGIGRMALRLSDVDLKDIYEKRPELDPKHNPDGYGKEWLKYIKGSASDTYKVSRRI